MNDAIYDYGDDADLGVTFKDSAGNVILQSAVTLTIRAPDGTVTTPDPDNPSTGVYTYVREALDQSGNWIGKWVGDDDVVPFGFYVKPDELTATQPALYVAPAELKQILMLQNVEFADLAIEIAIESASRACDGYKDTRYYAVEDETRDYTAQPHERSLRIDDISTLTSVSVDQDGDGTFEETWTRGTEFILEPLNAVADGRPWNWLTLKDRSGKRFPFSPGAVRVVGTFGWLTVPVNVKQATILLANRLLYRTRQAPLDVLVVAAGETVSLAHIGSIDKDVKFLLDQLPGGRPSLTAIQLS